MLTSLLLHGMLLFIALQLLEPAKIPALITSNLSITLLPQNLPANTYPSISNSKQNTNNIPKNPEHDTTIKHITSPDPAEKEGAENITGIAFPRSIETPYAINRIDQDPYYYERQKEREAMQLHQEKFQAAPRPELVEHQAQELIIRLDTLLNSLASTQNLPEGLCRVQKETARLSCSSPELSSKLEQSGKPILEIFSKLNALGKIHNGFILQQPGMSPRARIITVPVPPPAPSLPQKP